MDQQKKKYHLVHNTKHNTAEREENILSVKVVVQGTLILAVRNRVEQTCMMNKNLGAIISKPVMSDCNYKKSALQYM